MRPRSSVFLFSNSSLEITPSVWSFLRTTTWAASSSCGAMSTGSPVAAASGTAAAAAAAAAAASLSSEAASLQKKPRKRNQYGRQIVLDLPIGRSRSYRGRAICWLWRWRGALLEGEESIAVGGCFTCSARYGADGGDRRGDRHGDRHQLPL